MRHKEKWDAWNNSFGPKYPHEKLIQFIFRTFKTDRELIRILDLGCGSGANTLFLASEKFDVCATDISDIAVDNTLGRLCGLKAEVKTGVVSDIGFDDETFDCVVSIGVLECAGAAVFNEAFREIVRVLKPGGYAFLLFASDSDFRIVGNNQLGLHGFTDKEVASAGSLIRDSLEFFWMDRYITTHFNKSNEENNHLVTFQKRIK